MWLPGTNKRYCDVALPFARVNLPTPHETNSAAAAMVANAQAAWAAERAECSAILAIIALFAGHGAAQSLPARAANPPQLANDLPTRAHPSNRCATPRIHSFMTTIRVKENEPFDVALRRFKRTIEKLGLLTDLRAREFYEKPTAERKRKKAAAVKRHFKRVRSMQLPKKMY